MRIAVAHPCMGRGGSEARAMQALHGLTADGDTVDLLTAGTPDLHELNTACGTAVDPTALRIRQAPLLPGLGRVNHAAAIQGARHQRWCRRVAREYDLLISAYNLCDFGAPAIQFIADFAWDAELRAQYEAVPRHGARLIHRATPLRSAYLGLAHRISRPSGRNLFGGADRIIANSRWTANILSSKYGVECEVIYPPVEEPDPGPPWEQREQGFVCLGRIAHEKRIERIIEILSRVRELGHDIHLHLIGPIGNDPYGRMIRRLVNQHRDWVIPEGRKVGSEKTRLLHRHRYGISACGVEAFGIAVAEQVKAGCVPFVPNSGGQTEITDHPALQYEDPEDAVQKIDAVLRQDALQHRLLEHLGSQGQRFSAARFVDELRDVVARFRNESTPRNRPERTVAH